MASKPESLPENCVDEDFVVRPTVVHPVRRQPFLKNIPLKLWKSFQTTVQGDLQLGMVMRKGVVQGVDLQF